MSGTEGCGPTVNGSSHQQERERARSANGRPPSLEFGRHLHRSYLGLSDARPSTASPRDQYIRIGQRQTLALSRADQLPPRSPYPQFHLPNGHFSYRNPSKLSMVMRQKGNSLPDHNGGGPLRHAHSISHTNQPTLYDWSTSPGRVPREIDDGVGQQAQEEGDEVRRLAAYPGGHQPDSTRPTPIERYDWPAPASSAVVLAEIMRERRRRRSGGSGAGDGVDEDVLSLDIGASVSCDLPSDTANGTGAGDSLNIGKSGMVQAILAEEQKRRTRPSCRTSAAPTDPVSASRTPSASLEPSHKPRYYNHHFASPSRDNQRDRRTFHPLGYSLEYVNLGNRSWAHPASNSASTSQTSPRPDYPGNSGSLVNGLNNYGIDRAFSMDLGTRIVTTGFRAVGLERIRSRTADLAGDKIHLGNGNASDEGDIGSDQHRLQNVSNADSYPALLYSRPPPTAIFRRREPVPPPVIPYEKLKLNNRYLAKGADRTALETYLSDKEFSMLFEMPRAVFYRLPEWKRNDLKRQVQLF